MWPFECPSSRPSICQVPRQNSFLQRPLTTASKCHQPCSHYVLSVLSPTPGQVMVPSSLLSAFPLEGPKYYPFNPSGGSPFPLYPSRNLKGLSCPELPISSSLPFNHTILPNPQGSGLHSQPQSGPTHLWLPPKGYSPGCVCVLAQSLLLAPWCQANPHLLCRSCPKRSLPLEATLVATITIMSWATHFLL